MARRTPPYFPIPRSASHWIYTLLHPFGRWAIKIWHRVDVEGLEHVAAPDGDSGPARLLFSAHQNGLTDPVLACVTLPQQLHYFTRADVFTNPIARFFILRLNMMPVFRPIDRTPDMVERNRTTFDAAHQRLDAGAACGIFPEASQLDERRTRRFKHGSARFILSALNRPAVQSRGLEVIPMAFDFERYEGYRSKARIRIAQPLNLSGLPEGSDDDGPNRMRLSEQMRDAMVDLSVELVKGDHYDAHLALCRYAEGRTGSRPDPNWLAERGQALVNAGEDSLIGFRNLIESGISHPRRGDGFAAIGRLHAHGPTRLTPMVLRLPAWAIFRLTTGWWPRLMEPLMAKRIKQVGFRTTCSVPATMLAILVTWATISALITALTTDPILGLLTLPFLRFCQAVAMPFEDAWIDRLEERRARRFTDNSWITKWAGTLD